MVVTFWRKWLSDCRPFQVLIDIEMANWYPGYLYLNDGDPFASQTTSLH